MRAPSRNRVILEGSIQDALDIRRSLQSAADLMVEGEDKDNLTALIVHLTYGMEDALRSMDEDERQVVLADLCVSEAFIFGDFEN